MSFGERLKELRNQKHISQTQLAELTGLHYTQIGRYEKEKSMPSSDILKKIAEIFVNTDINFPLFTDIRFPVLIEIYHT